MKLSDIIKDDDIYPRGNISQKTVGNYYNTMLSGEVFPNILIQKVQKDNKIILILLDGLHRKIAYNEYVKYAKKNSINIENKLGISFWKKEVLNYEENFEDMLIKATQCNMKHGDRLKENDLAKVCQKIVDNRELDRLHGVEKELAEFFGKPASTISDYITKNISKRRASRDDKIYRISKMGNNQKEVGEMFNLSQPQIGKIMQNFEIEVLHILKIGINKGKTFEQLATENQLHTLTPYIAHLEDQNDEKKFEIFLKQNPRCYDVWNFHFRDKRLGIKAHGNIAGQIIMNLLYYYTKQGDLVLDPVAGGGSTIDACLVMGRKCLAFDINPLRDDIIQNDSTKLIPIKKKVDFIFLDPPFFNMDNKIGNYKDINDFYNQIDKIIKNSVIHLKVNSYIAMIMGNLTVKQETCIGHECYNILKNSKLKFINHISVPHSTEQYNAKQVTRYKKNKHIMAINNDLYIFQKIKGE